MLSNRAVQIALCILGFSSLTWGQTPMPKGNEFQVNSYTTGNQRTPSVAMGSDGSFVVVWESSGQDYFFGGVFGQRYAAEGTTLGGEFQINTFTTGNQLWPSAAADTNGNFIVVWESHGQGGGNVNVYGRRFTSDGTPVGSEFWVNSYTTGSQSRPAVAMDSTGDFIVVWETFGQDGSFEGGVSGRLFANDGTPVGGDFQVNTYTTGHRYNPSVAMDADGDFVVVWDSYGQGGSSSGIFARRFANDGSPAGSEFQVNSYSFTTYTRGGPKVALGADGDMAFVWSSYHWTNDLHVLGRVFTNDGSPRGSGLDIFVNSYVLDNRAHPSVASEDNGDFVVVWENFAYGVYGIFGQRFAGNGTFLGSQFQVSSHTTSAQTSPTIAMNRGDFVVAWESSGQDGYGLGVFAQQGLAVAQRYELAADFGVRGLWHYQDGWSKLSGWDSEALEGWQNKLAADFGESGLWLYDLGGWTKITGWDPAQMVDCGADLVANFGIGRGVWTYDSSDWTKISNWDSENLVCSGQGVVGDFGASQGLWTYDFASWTKLTNWDAVDLVTSGDKVVVNFGPTRGLWIYDDAGWTKLTNWEADRIISCCDQIVVAFKSGRGLWVYADVNGWTKISGWNPYDLNYMQGGGNMREIVAAFDLGRGLWFYHYTLPPIWLKLTNWEPVLMEALSQKLVADFGIGRGIYTYDIGWTKISNWDSEALEGVGIY